MTRSQTLCFWEVPRFVNRQYDGGLFQPKQVRTYALFRLLRAKPFGRLTLRRAQIRWGQAAAEERVSLVDCTNRGEPKRPSRKGARRPPPLRTTIPR